MSHNNNAPLEIVIARHGETTHNEMGILQGQFDSELNELGRRQAAAAGAAMKGECFQACYASDLMRAMETANIILDRAEQKITVTPEPALREWHLGVLENRPHRELVLEFPELMASFKREGGDVIVPGGESKMEFAVRIHQYLQRVAQIHKPGEKILLVTHGGVLQMLFRSVVGLVNNENLKPLVSNASVSKIRYFHHLKSFQLVTWNDTSHLNNLEEHATLAY